MPNGLSEGSREVLGRELVMGFKTSVSEQNLVKTLAPTFRILECLKVRAQPRDGSTGPREHSDEEKRPKSGEGAG